AATVATVAGPPESLRNRPLGAPLCDEAPHEEHDDGADHRADESGAFARCVPSERLSEIARDERADDAEDRRHDESRRLVVARHDELRDDACDEPDDDRPDDSHRSLPCERSVTPSRPSRYTGLPVTPASRADAVVCAMAVVFHSNMRRRI